VHDRASIPLKNAKESVSEELEENRAKKTKKCRNGKREERETYSLPPAPKRANEAMNDMTGGRARRVRVESCEDSKKRQCSHCVPPSRPADIK